MGNKEQKYLFTKVICRKHLGERICHYCGYDADVNCYQFINNVIPIKVYMRVKDNKIKMCDGMSDALLEFMQNYIVTHSDIVKKDTARSVITKNDTQIGIIHRTKRELIWEFFCQSTEFFKYHKYDTIGYDNDGDHFRIRVSNHPLYGQIYVK